MATKHSQYVNKKKNKRQEYEVKFKIFYFDWHFSYTNSKLSQNSALKKYILKFIYQINIFTF